MKTSKASALLPFAVLFVAATLAFAGVGASLADKGGCPNENSANGGDHADDHSAHGGEKKHDRDCHPGPPGSEATPTDVATPAAELTPTPTPDPTASPTPSPSQEPTATPSPEPTATSTPEPTATPTPEPTATPTPEPTPLPATGTPTPAPTPTPPPGADVQVVNVTVNAPASAGAGARFVVTGGANIRNNGPVTPAIVDTTFTPTLPPGCTSTTGVMTVQNTTLIANMNVFVSRSWTVTCAAPGIYAFSVNVSVAIDAAQAYVDPNPGNNIGSGAGTTNVN